MLSLSQHKVDSHDAHINIAPLYLGKYVQIWRSSSNEGPHSRWEVNAGWGAYTGGEELWPGSKLATGAAWSGVAGQHRSGVRTSPVQAWLILDPAVIKM